MKFLPILTTAVSLCGGSPTPVYNKVPLATASMSQVCATRLFTHRSTSLYLRYTTETAGEYPVVTASQRTCYVSVVSWSPVVLSKKALLCLFWVTFLRLGSQWRRHKDVHITGRGKCERNLVRDRSLEACFLHWVQLQQSVNSSKASTQAVSRQLLTWKCSSISEAVEGAATSDATDFIR
jgi:hypothetical protein